MQVNLSDSEWKLMNHLWQSAPRTITELTAALKAETGWSKNTVITMLDRLETKGAVRYEPGRARQYYPAVERRPPGPRRRASSPRSTAEAWG